MGQSGRKLSKNAPSHFLSRAPGSPAHIVSLVNRASSLNTFAGHGCLACTVIWRSCLGLRLISRASSPNTFARQTPALVTISRRHFSEELFVTWALLGHALQRSSPGEIQGDHLQLSFITRLRTMVRNSDLKV